MISCFPKIKSQVEFTWGGFGKYSAKKVYTSPALWQWQQQH